MIDPNFIDLILENPFDWDKKSYCFNRDEKDMHPYSIINEKTRSIIIHNILGIDKKDLKLTLLKENGNTYILIEGKTIDEITKKEYSISSRFAIDETQLELSGIQSLTRNGLLYIIMPFKKENKEKSRINIKID